MDTTELLKVEEAAEKLRVSRWTVYNLIRERKLRTIKIGARRLVPVRAIADCIALLEEEAAA